MTKASDHDELYGVQVENRHLKEMVGALREELERRSIGEQDRLQQALAASSEEINQLRKMIASLREEMERRNIEYGEKCQAIEQTAREEAKQLHEMIWSLRDKLEYYGKK